MIRRVRGALLVGEWSVTACRVWAFGRIERVRDVSIAIGPIRATRARRAGELTCGRPFSQIALEHWRAHGVEC